jgi:hypothetical protein
LAFEQLFTIFKACCSIPSRLLETPLLNLNESDWFKGLLEKNYSNFKSKHVHENKPFLTFKTKVCVVFSFENFWPFVFLLQSNQKNLESMFNQKYETAKII